MHDSNKPGMPDPPGNRLPSPSMHSEAHSTHPEKHASTQDDFVIVQVGGGRREPSPAPATTPMRLRQKIKATTKDTGLVREASHRRSHMSPIETAIGDCQNADDVNPFLSEPNIQAAAKVQTATSLATSLSKSPAFYKSHPIFNANVVGDDDTPRPTPAAQKPEASVHPLDTLTRVPSVQPLDLSRASSIQPLDIFTKASSKSRSVLASTLDRLGFEPANFGNITDVSACVTCRQR